MCMMLLSISCELKGGCVLPCLFFILIPSVHLKLGIPRAVHAKVQGRNIKLKFKPEPGLTEKPEARGLACKPDSKQIYHILAIDILHFAI